ncbi:MAG: hypothetical protein PHE68_01600 [Candidatus Peribacteraceae bacterium]|nr:hypothetical protein [Candidatus Peribacteraceae bacterium]MDD5075196.1 hypothetical protein [Candidatus Peribacteraceae bacterium]
MENDPNSIGSDNVISRHDVLGNTVVHTAASLGEPDPESVLEFDLKRGAGNGDSSSLHHDRTTIDPMKSGDSVIERNQRALAELKILFGDIKTYRREIANLLRSRANVPVPPRFDVGGDRRQDSLAPANGSSIDREEVDKRCMLIRTLASHLRGFEQKIDAEIHPRALEVIAGLAGFENRRELLASMTRIIAAESDRRVPVNMAVPKAEREVQKVVAETWLSLIETVRSRFNFVPEAESKP